MNVELEALIARWKGLMDRKEFDEARVLYFAEILRPLLIDIREAHASVRELRGPIHTLVSLMGFSPETTLIATAALKPERLVIVYSGGVPESYKLATRFILDNEKLTIDLSAVSQQRVDSTDYESIYSAVRGAIDLESPGLNVVDVTGGKKVMSATAGAAGWRLDTPLAYVEGQWNNAYKRPEPATERVIFLDNPADFKLAEARTEAVAAFAASNYVTAREKFELVRSYTRGDWSFDQFGIQLCDCYGALADLNFDALRDHVTRLRTLSQQDNVRREVIGDRSLVDPHIDALAKACDGNPIVLAGTCLRLATAYSKQGRFDFACLLLYRTMESLAVSSLCGGERSEFDPLRPDWEILAQGSGDGSVDDLERRYLELAKRNRALPSTVSFADAIALLCILDGIHEREPFALDKPMPVVGRMWELARLRNQSILAHGTRILTADDYVQLENGALDLARAALSEGDHAHMRAQRDLLAPLDIAELQPKAI